MYSMKPLVENFNLTTAANTVTTMYECKSYYKEEEDEQKQHQQKNKEAIKQVDCSNNTSSTTLDDLNRQQQSQLRRLERLKEKLNQFCDDLNLNHLIQTTTTTTPPIKKKSPSPISIPTSTINVQRANTKTQKSKQCVDDLVIHFDVTNESVVGPLTVFTLFNQLSLKYKSFIQFYLHGTVLKEKEKLIYLNKLIELFNQLKLSLNNEPRNAYDYGVTLVAKKFNQIERQLGSAILTLPQTNGKKIFGEANIARYLNRLVNQQQKQSNGLDYLMSDECIDKFNNNNNNIKEGLDFLNKQLKTSIYLTGDKLSLADYYVWSQLRQQQQANSDKNASTNTKSPLNEWSKRLESSDSFIQLLNSILLN